MFLSPLCLIASWLVIIITTCLASSSHGAEWVFGNELTPEEHGLYNDYLLSTLTALRENLELMKDNPWWYKVFLAVEGEKPKRKLKVALAYVPHTLDYRFPMKHIKADPKSICYVVRAACIFDPNTTDDVGEQLVADTITQLGKRLREDHLHPYTEGLWKYHQAYPVRIAINKEGLSFFRGTQASDSRIRNVLKMVAKGMGSPESPAIYEDNLFKPPAYDILTLETPTPTSTPTQEPAGN